MIQIDSEKKIFRILILYYYIIYYYIIYNIYTIFIMIYYNTITNLNNVIHYNINYNIYTIFRLLPVVNNTLLAIMIAKLF